MTKHVYHRFFGKDDWEFGRLRYSLDFPFTTGKYGSYVDPEVTWLVPDVLVKIQFECADAEAMYIVEIPDDVDLRAMQSGTSWLRYDGLNIRHKDFETYSTTMIDMCRAARDGNLAALRDSVAAEHMRARPEEISYGARMALKFSIRQGHADHFGVFQELSKYLTKDDILRMMQFWCLFVCDLENKDPSKWRGFAHKDRGQMLYVPKPMLETFNITDDEVTRCFDALHCIDGNYLPVSFSD